HVEDVLDLQPLRLEDDPAVLVDREVPQRMRGRERRCTDEDAEREPGDRDESRGAPHRRPPSRSSSRRAMLEYRIEKWGLIRSASARSLRAAARRPVASSIIARRN